ncbi:hypothetical protein HETIRDRAFT_421198 [Heterobasidion irregulare TC 32-1]|uniref:Uncharacterized protein n=1 Tax=Heterobasidion irregulare (strain TC 32-1) TaxID=747525 RepID=W4JTU7_HETIT|nr:uncharacterized protein HETIRDRAFT_421198 [Heterobasidion irregulare TC 32-1]ETW76978.1 hypothetical protein HETIRDRAFT_421198 [Heterobasidion irregulare TC 32-1]
MADASTATRPSRAAAGGADWAAAGSGPLGGPRACSRPTMSSRAAQAPPALPPRPSTGWARTRSMLMLGRACTALAPV